MTASREGYIVPCLRCKAGFERRRRGPVTHHCGPCRVVIQRERARDRAARARKTVDTALSRLPEEVGTTAREYAYTLALSAGSRLPAVADRMPPGSKSPLGSDDGRSTYFTRLAEDLDARAKAAARHVCQDTEGPYAHFTEADCGQCFWEREPHWCVDL